MIIDTHSHIYEPEFDSDRSDIVKRALTAGVELMLMPAIDTASDERMFNTYRKYPNITRPMIGLHPTSINNNPLWEEELSRIERYLTNPPYGVEKFCGIGEIGLDLYWSSEFRREQTEALIHQIELSLQYKLPIVIHTRNAWNEMRDVMQSFRGRGVKGVFHAFSDSVDSYNELRSIGDFLFGIGGVVTFRKSQLVDTVQQMSLDDIVLETDCPYLPPVPHRGERNEPSYIRFVCDKIAEIKGVSMEEVMARTTANTKRMFDIK